ncbi:YT521-B-like domain-containing protein [Irpex rosettiformis]|uniref:YT521-B-like domain-containing protein n=1 Tax=Irpex rosettiformis TaxID=378272 RepID=A0ACB8UHY7_9APHY|nr:YT521-B-like domain-containing protein [Irpex rosettiformis]
MSGQQEYSVSPPPGSAGNASTVRRHHTISASSRTARPASRIQDSELDDDENEQAWGQDDVVDQDWHGGIGAVGEKSSLHRQASLPTKYHRAFGEPGQRKPGNTSITHNSLTAIAGANEHEEEEWETDLRGLRNEDETFSSSDHGHNEANASPLSQHFSGGIQGTSPPPPDSGAAVRRHQSLTYTTHTGARNLHKANLRRAGTLQAPTIREPAPHSLYNSAQSPSPTLADEEFETDSVRAEEDGYFRPHPTQQGQYPTSPIRRSSPWSTPDPQDWRAQRGGNVPANIAPGSGVDDVALALSSLELKQQQYGGNNFQPEGSRKLQLRTDVEQQLQQEAVQSASAYVPPIGHGIQGGVTRQGEDYHAQRERALTTSGSTPWDQKERLLSGRASNPNLQHLYQSKNGSSPIPNVPPIPSQFFNSSSGQGPRLGQSQVSNNSVNQQGRSSTGPGQTVPSDNFLASPLDVPTLIATKGYNPVEFDTRPLFAKYFVIKSYTEDDVHKSLKYEIWSSTDPGNKRLDKAFKENAGRGPIYLFFSVNASDLSGHFCGMAEMLTPVDYTRSSTVWASDKWKGVFKVRWIFVRDIPNASLRHIRLQNTQERKPVTNSRDTQELLSEAGQEMLRIFHTHPARTSLLQDFAFYELQAMQKVQSQMQSGASSPDQPGSSVASPILGAASPVQHPFAMSNPAALAYAAQMGMTPMNQMNMMNPMLQMQMGLNGMNAAYANPQAMQSVLRQQSPNPMGNQNYMNIGGMTGI